MFNVTGIAVQFVLGFKISYGTMQPLKATISNNKCDPQYEYLDTANAKK